MKTPRNLLAALLLLFWLTGCCTSQSPPQPVPHPTSLGTDSLDPKALSNRMLTSLLISSPLATARHASIFVHTFTQPNDHPELVASLQHLAQSLATQPRFSLASSGEDADYTLLPQLSSDGATPLFRLCLSAQSQDTPVWTFTQQLEGR